MLLDAHAAGTLAHDGDGIGIAAKGGDVVAHPLDGSHLVIQAVVAGVAGFLLQLGQAQETHGSQTVV